MPVLIAAAGVPALRVDNVDGVRVGGILFQAGTAPTTALVQWGTPLTATAANDVSAGGTNHSQARYYAGNAAAPGFLHDVYARVGGPNAAAQYQVQVETMVRIDAGHVVIDNAWLWRADHDVSGDVKNADNPNLHGLVVNGDDVSAYGLAVEHCLNDLVVWNGERGNTFFFQSELPYDVTQQQFGDPAYVGYRVAPQVQSHSLAAAGAARWARREQRI